METDKNNNVQSVPLNVSIPNLVYFNNFESTVGSEWSNTTADNTYPDKFSRFLGRFSNDSAALTLSTIPGTTYRLEFDLYAIDSWDGNYPYSIGPDYLNVSIDNTRVFHETFSNVNASYYGSSYTQSFRPPESGGVTTNLGFSSWGDSIYRRIPLVFTATNSTTQIRFADSGLQGLDDESWGIDNVKVWTTDPNPPAPDLVVSNIVAPASASLKDTIPISWTVTNRGVSAAPNNWLDKIYLSQDATLDSSDIQLSTVSAADQTPLAVDASYTLSQNIVLPNDAIGDWYLLMAADAYKSQTETDETNNVSVVPLHIKAPDLVVSAATAPITAAERSTINLSWTVTNQGEAAASGQQRYWWENSGWNDAVYLSDNTVWDGSDRYVGEIWHSTQTPLAAGGNYTVTQNLTLPDRTGAGTWYVLFITDRDNHQVETADTNNVTAVPIDITTPDLIVSAATAPVLAAVGQNIQVSWTVKNQGDVQAAADWYDAIYLSDDATLDSSDTNFYTLGTGDKTPLVAGDSYTINQNVTLPGNTAAGKRYLLFASDRDNNQSETQETNNVIAIPIELAAPDLVASTATDPTEAGLGETIGVSWSVTNTGDVSAFGSGHYWWWWDNNGWSDRIYISDDTTLDSSDTYVSERWMGERSPLTAGDSYTTSQNVTIPGNTAPGKRYLLFVTDSNGSQTETNETNNIYAVPITLKAPDLVFSATTSPTEANAGDTINLSWTVTNQESAATSRYDWYDRVYFSTDQKFDYWSDTYLTEIWSGNYDSYQPLASGASYTVSQNVTLPNIKGAGYLLFVSDIWNYQQETNETNNIKAVPITLKGQQADLIVSAAAVPNAVALGQSVSVSWTVANSGDAATPSYYWYDSVYLSDDTTFDSSDTYVTDEYAPYHNSWSSLGAGDNYTVTRDIYIPGTKTGNRYLLFVADRLNYQSESNEANNVYAVPIEIKASDLVISDVTAPSTAIVNQTVPVSWTVTNKGNANTPSYSWYDHIYLSNDPSLDGSDTLITYEWSGYHDSYQSLAENASYTVTRDITLPNSGVGKRYLLFAADGWNYQGESNETNNIYAVPIELTAPDLVVSAATAPSAAVVNGTIGVSWTVTNNGSVDAFANWYDYIFVSDDATYDRSDTYVSNHWSGEQIPLAAGDSYTLSQNITLPNTKTGNRYLLFVSDRDNYQGETDETNNVKAIPITLTAPDLAVSEATAPLSAGVGETVAVSWNVTNQGNVEAFGNWYDAVYLSDDATFNNSDRFLNNLWVGDKVPLTAGASYTATQNITIPNYVAAGKRYLIFVADKYDYQGETDETNNVKAVPIEIIAPDLVVSDATTPTNANSGDSIDISWTVSNQGTVAATTDWYDYIFLSGDPYYDSSDTYVTSRWIGEQTPLVAGSNYTINQNIILPNTGAGQRYLLFVTDLNNYQSEADETNNVKAIPITINGQNADLVISAATAPTRAVLGQNITTTWTVTNQGELATPSYYWYDRVYLSDDERVDSTDTYLTQTWSGYYDSYQPLAAGGSYQVTLNLDVPATKIGNRYLLFVTDIYNYQSETSETNNVKAVPISLQASDLVVTNATAPSKSLPGARIGVSWTVKNQGDVAAAADWYDSVYLSTDSKFDPNTDINLKDAWTGSLTPLAVNDSYTVNQFLSLPNVANGSYYLLFAADRNNYQFEGNESNNIYSLPIQLGESQPDLVITTAASPSAAILGDAVEVSWTVKNQGNFEAPADWYDTIYISDDTTLDSTDTIVTSLGMADKTPLAAGASYTIAKSITIPNTKTGSRYLLFVADAGAIQNERGATRKSEFWQYEQTYSL